MSRPRDRLVLASLFLMVLASSGQMLVVSPLLPEIARELPTSEALQGWLLTGFAVALAVFALLVGPASDRFGRRKILLCGTGSMVLSLLAHGLATSFEALLVCRILAGMSGGLLTGAAVAYVSDYFPAERRGFATGWVMSGFAFGQVATVPLATLIGAAAGFRAAFLLFAALMALSFVLIWRYFPQPPVRTPRTPLGVSSALAGYGRLLRSSRVLAAAAAYGMVFFHFSLLVVFFPTWVQERLDVGTEATASLFLAGGAASLLVGPQAGRLSDRVGRRPIILASCAATVLLALALPLLVHNLFLANVAFVAVMALYAARMTPFQALLPTLVSEEERGSLLSLVVALGQLAGGVGGAVAGWVYARWGYAADAALAAAAMAAMGLLVWRFLPEPRGCGEARRVL